MGPLFSNDSKEAKLRMMLGLDKQTVVHKAEKTTIVSKRDVL